MKIGLSQFQQRFVQRATEFVPSAEVKHAVDSVTLSPAIPPAQAFAQVALAVATAAQGGGVAALAALSQDVARSLIGPADEEKLAEGMRDGFQSRFVPSEPKLEQAWRGVQRVTQSPFPAPQEVNSPIVYAQADTRNLYVGKEALETDLADPNVLTFTLGHEEGHREQRDMAANKGLELFMEAAANDPKLSRLAFQVTRAGRHANERRADENGARVAARLGCDPLPILDFLLPIAEDAEHPSGYERARLVRQTMAEEGVCIPDGEWRKRVIHDPRGETQYAELGQFHADPASWQPFHTDRLDELRHERVRYLHDSNPQGALIVLDQFFVPAGAAMTHGQMVTATARQTGFSGPILEADTTYSLQPNTVKKLDAMAAAEKVFQAAEEPAAVRAALRELSVLKRSYSLERTAETLEQLVEAGTANSAVNVSLGHNAADETRRLLQRTIATEGQDPQQVGKVLVQVLRGFCQDWQSFISSDAAVSGQERARVAAAVADFFQQTVQDPHWQAARERYDRAVEALEAQNNSVVVSAGNEGDCASFLEAWCLGQSPTLPEGFENNDLSNSHVTVVGALDNGKVAPYSSHDAEVDVYADGRSALGEDEKGTSFAAPRVAARMAKIHAEHPDWSSPQVEKRLGATE